eukprot:CAMPEP_0172430860 /NCGR_PEP_ID=MMETSP1064-20121228/56350_1 /TAXON_ID=202472 /ORGANISM="Aulacoseira subarctica , Strain CCAP 1002/5" /LENGTH=93 /DNA_ID=CAMNT_0013177241 /DNA_START=12 /DNA_END=289 /DNA_ORIENTATION=+
MPTNMPVTKKPLAFPIKGPVLKKPAGYFTKMPMTKDPTTLPTKSPVTKKPIVYPIIRPAAVEAYSKNPEIPTAPPAKAVASNPVSAPSFTIPT